jgi:4-hydroxybenzoyl-CoA thioesterase
MSEAFHRRLTIRFADVDYARVLYFPTQFHLLHTVMEDFFRDVVGIPYPEMLQRDRIGFPTVHLEADFREPLRFGEEIDVAMRVKELGRRKVVFGYEITRLETGEVTGLVTQTTVAVNPETWQPIELPPRYREALGKLAAG